ncbi:hypothetical protein TRAPUB_9014 [Trametes pubescens]|uniref:Uncharacterized protein n=1 Tax=Trametes pubescens TaxID=154538 RepID=A0A1M2W3Q1_TRAPU|nr:hypothetical protein TRAPUB_9014 [Trametes pubescens]
MQYAQSEDEGSGSEVEVSGSDDEYESALNGSKSPSPPPARDVKGKGKAFGSVPPARSSSHQTSAKKAGSWADLDLSIIVALVSPVGNWLTGGDHIKNLFLIILLIFYLHQIVEIPWQLYLSARPRKHQPRHAAKKHDDDKVAHLLALAETELRRHELFYLCIALSSPFIGAAFLRYVLSALGDHNALSWFSTTLFVLATGIRPWTHLVNRLNERTQELHNALHTPTEETLAFEQEETRRTLDLALQRIDALERELDDLREGVKRGEQLREVCDDLSEVLGDIERASKRNERKADIARSALSTRLSTVEIGLVQMEERRRKDVAALEAAGFRIPEKAVLFAQAREHFWTLVRKVLYYPRALWLFGLAEPQKQASSTSGTPLSPGENGNDHNTVHVSGILLNRLHSPEREKHLALPRLATIPEAEDSDSEGTFVSDKEHPRKGSRSRSRSRSMSASSRTVKTPSHRSRAYEYAQDAVLWPYRFSSRVLVAVFPPVAKIVPKL